MSVTKTQFQTCCRGLNHSHTGDRGRCDNCRAEVVAFTKGEFTKVVDPTYWNGHLTFFCFSPSHECDPNSVAFTQLLNDEKYSEGELVKGREVVVYKGRKVPKGTVGILIWIGEDSWGESRVGIKDSEGTVHWTAASNVKNNL